jgi:hypothetical protein
MTAREREAVARRSRRDASSPAGGASRRRGLRDGAGAKAPPRPKPTWRISSSGARFGLFSYKYLRQTKGIWAGHPLALEPFQIVVMSDLLQVEHEQWLDLTDDDAKDRAARPGDVLGARRALARRGGRERTACGSTARGCSASRRRTASRR